MFYNGPEHFTETWSWALCSCITDTLKITVLLIWTISTYNTSRLTPQFSYIIVLLVHTFSYMIQGLQQAATNPTHTNRAPNKNFLSFSNLPSLTSNSTRDWATSCNLACTMATSLLAPRNMATLSSLCFTAPSSWSYSLWFSSLASSTLCLATLVARF